MTGSNLPDSASLTQSSIFSSAFLSTVISTLEISASQISISSIKVNSMGFNVQNDDQIVVNNDDNYSKINNNDDNNGKIMISNDDNNGTVYNNDDNFAKVTSNDENKSHTVLTKRREQIKSKKESFSIDEIVSNNIHLASNIMIADVSTSETVSFLFQLSVEVTGQLISKLNTAVSNGQFATQFSSNYGNTVNFTGQFMQSTAIGEPVSDNKSAGSSRSGKIRFLFVIIITVFA